MLIQVMIGMFAVGMIITLLNMMMKMSILCFIIFSLKDKLFNRTQSYFIIILFAFIILSIPILFILFLIVNQHAIICHILKQQIIWSFK